MKYSDFIQFDLTELPEGTGLRDACLRIAPKTPEQQEAVAERLRKFGLNHSPELVALFPFHPRVLALLESISFVPPPVQVRLLLAAARQAAESPCIPNGPGFIAADQLWLVLRADAELQRIQDIEAVIRCTGELEKKIARKFSDPSHRELALRLARVLALHRLASPDIYSHGGGTVDELAELLCLAGPEPDASARLQADSAEVLRHMHHLGGTQCLSSNPETGQHHLQIKEFKRFVKPEVVLHWVNALPFLCLLATGAVMLASRFLHWQGIWISRAELAHQISAATWLLAVPPAVMLRLNVHWDVIRTVLTWGKTDLLWFVQSMRVLYDKNAKVPPAGRFNAGQKMNTVLVLLYFFGFGGTGLLMFFKGSILFPWYVHTALFFSAMGSVGGHLFLAFINPSTRIALFGIFHGWAPMKYIEHHHPLSLPPSLRSHAHAPTRKTLREEISISKVELVILAITVILGIAGAITFGFARMETVKDQFSKKFAQSISPRELTTWHRVGPSAESCVKCHSYTGELPNAKCEACHQDIKERRANRTGYHGVLTNDCRTCHQEHRDDPAFVPLDRKHFDHHLAAFQLEGKHARLDCDACHKKPRPEPVAGITMRGVYFTGLKFANCTDCHADRHNGQFAAPCQKCHSPAGWQRPNLKFSHDLDSSFRLTGKHTPLDCVKCHKPADTKAPLGTAKFKGLPSDCAGCHEDPHRRQFDRPCTVCHTPGGWKKDALLFQHNRDSKFPLMAKHADTACEKCHRPSAPGEKLAAAQMHGLKTGCADCHQDPHSGQFKTDCTRCHLQPDSWKGKSLHFDHNRDAKFTLVGKHAAAACVKCHQPRPAGGELASAQFVGLKSSCADCHPPKHPVEYGSLCVSCHAVSQWGKNKPAADHASRHTANGELLLGQHITARCDACHNAQRVPALGFLGATQYDCAGCHAAKDPHRGTLGQNCAKCHNSDAWKGESMRFSHDTMTRWPLNQDHRHVACVKCHADNHWKPVNSACESCHPKITKDKTK
ncbi:MAG TPA: DUF6079 family protein [Verrucomicrobiae bacterium]